MGFGREHMRARDGRGEVKEEGKHTHIHTQAHKHTSTRAHTHTHTHTHTYTHTHAHTHTHARKGGGRVRVAERPPTPINPPPLTVVRFPWRAGIRTTVCVLGWHARHEQTWLSPVYYRVQGQVWACHRAGVSGDTVQHPGHHLRLLEGGDSRSWHHPTDNRD